MGADKASVENEKKLAEYEMTIEELKTQNALVKENITKLSVKKQELESRKILQEKKECNYGKSISMVRK